MATGAVQMLHKSLLDAQKDLSSTDDAIKRLIGRDPNTRPPPRTTSVSGPERRISNGGSSGRMRAWSGNLDNKPPAPKRRDTAEGGRTREVGREVRRIAGPRRAEPRGDGGGTGGERRRREIGGIHSRLGPPPGGAESEEEEEEGEEEEEKERVHKKPSMQSSVVTTKPQPRPMATSDDESNKKRNRRMFGFLMGTLQKFKADEDSAKTSDKERRRQEIDEKVEQIQVIEKEEAIQARKELFEQRKQHKLKIARLSGQVEAVSMYDEWNSHDKLLLGYISTKTKPEIFYLPVEHIPRTEKLLAETKDKIEGRIKKRQEEVESLVAEQQKESKEEEAMELEGEGQKPGGEGEGEGLEGGVGSGEASD